MIKSAPRRTYRQILAWATAAALVVTLTACEDRDSASSDDAPSSETLTSQQTDAPAPDQDAEGSTQPADEQESAATPMEAAFAAGRSVVCTYTYEAYDATTTLRSKEMFRIDQHTQGGLAHVVRGPEDTLIWIDGMVEAMVFDTEAYEQDATGQYPTFEPRDFDDETLFADGTCQAQAAAEDALFELPSDMTAAPAQP